MDSLCSAVMCIGTMNQNVTRNDRNSWKLIPKTPVLLIERKMQTQTDKKKRWQVKGMNEYRPVPDIKEEYQQMITNLYGKAEIQILVETI